MSRKGQSVTLSISEPDKAELMAIALELGMTWGERPNISKLVEGIARRKLLVLPNNDWSQTRINTLVRAYKALTDAGELGLALEMAKLLLERSELSIPRRREIEGFVGNPPPSWRLELERYIRRNQPFELDYRDAMDQPWHFTIYHAQINFHEKRHYLDCWCEETEGNQDLPELTHNWCLRLDRIPEAAITPVKGSWRSNLAQLEVEMHLFGTLAFAYHTKTGDISNDWLAGSQRVKRVVRRISSTFWFIREVLQYGKNCEIVSPEAVRSRIKEELLSMCDRYEIS
ncbi:MAG: WYL domain-containing protein [Symploca sp. SIO2G7]|nr:WYL domain-containing protein [Symploca sp. SIO2G7]